MFASFWLRAYICGLTMSLSLLLLGCGGGGGPKHEVNLGDQGESGVVEAKYAIGDDGHVVALRDVVGPDGSVVVRAGERGGWVQHRSSLAHSGSAWVGPDARIEDDGQVFGDARVFGSAVVSGDALVYGSAHVYGAARVHGSAQVLDAAAVYGNAELYGNSMVFDSSFSTDYRGNDIFEADSLPRLIWSNSETAETVDITAPSVGRGSYLVNGVNHRVSSMVKELYISEETGKIAAVKDSYWEGFEDILQANRADGESTALRAKVLGAAVVKGDSKIWGGSYIEGGLLEDGAWISGQTSMFGARVCEDLWVNNYPGVLGGSLNCSVSSNVANYIVYAASLAGLLLVGLCAVAAVRRRARPKSTARRYS